MHKINIMSKSSSSDLFHFIKSLDKKEKKYFRRFASSRPGGTEAKYVKLFDAIKKQDEYSEEKIIGSLKISGKPRLANMKKHLHNLVLHAMRDLHAGGKMESRLNELSETIPLLFEKGLYSQCIKTLRSARKLAYEKEDFSELLHLIEWEKRMAEARVYGGFSRNINDIENEEKMLSEKLQIMRNYQNIRYYIHRHYSGNGFARTKKEQQIYLDLLKKDALRNRKEKLPYNAQCDYYFARGVCYFATSDWEKCYSNQKSLIAFMEAYPGRLQYEKRKYLTTLTNFFAILRLMGKYDECIPVLSKIRSIHFDDRANTLELDMYASTGDFKKGLPLAKKTEHKMQHSSGTPYENTVDIFNITYTYFGLADYNSSLKWINKIINNEANAKTDIYCFAKILNLIIHFELGNTELLEYIVKSTYGYLYRRKRLYKFETCVLDFIRNKISRTASRGELLNSFKSLRTDLTRLSHDPFEKQALEYFDFISWLDSKIENRPFADIVREKAGRV